MTDLDFSKIKLYLYDCISILKWHIVSRLHQLMRTISYIEISVGLYLCDLCCLVFYAMPGSWYLKFFGCYQMYSRSTSCVRYAAVCRCEICFKDLCCIVMLVMYCIFPFISLSISAFLSYTHMVMFGVTLVDSFLSVHVFRVWVWLEIKLTYMLGLC